MNIIITGASRGIGHAVARAFLSVSGHTVGVVARNAASLEQLSTGCAADSRVLPYPFDLSHGNIQELVKLISQDFDKVDILINNAGYLVKKPFVALTQEDYLESMKVNFLAPVMLTQGLLPLLERSPVKHVVNITSMGGYQGTDKIAGLAAYSASKAALNNVSELLGTELAEKGVHINALAPGAVDTEMLRQALPGYQAPVTPEEMAAFIYTFATTAWKVINGKVIPVALSAT
jgi:NAD(P)-dependent dehydrogenase (short-subunit alcohol dehydrogenase family)